MHFDSHRRKAIILFSTAAVALCSLALTIRSAVAHKLGSSLDDISALRRAAALDPSNAARHHWLGRVALFVDQDSGSAVRELEETTRLNPWVADYWLDLALAYKSAGNTDGESRALEHALFTEPRNLNAVLSEGSFYLSRGETGLAMQRFRVVLENDPPEAVSIFDTCWRATHDVHAVLDALPPRASLHFRLLELMVRYGELEASRQVWERLVTLPKPFETGKPLAYIDRLIQMKQPAPARRAWDQFQRITSNQSQSTSGELLVNGGFENELQNAGFDWRFPASGAVTFEQDKEQSHSGKRSLAINYTGASTTDAGIWQLFPAEPGEYFRLSAFAKSKDLLASERPRLAVEDFYSHSIIATGAPIEESSSWHPTSVVFSVPADCHLLAIKIEQGQTPTRIKGTLWVDDFQLNQNPSPSVPLQ